MKVEFKEGFKLELIAESEIERLFMREWEARAKISITDSRDLDYELMDPAFINWKMEQKE